MKTEGDYKRILFNALDDGWSGKVESPTVLQLTKAHLTIIVNSTTELAKFYYYKTRIFSTSITGKEFDKLKESTEQKNLQQQEECRASNERAFWTYLFE